MVNSSEWHEWTWLSPPNAEKNAARGTAILSPRVTLRAASIVCAASGQSTEAARSQKTKNHYGNMSNMYIHMSGLWIYEYMYVYVHIHVNIKWVLVLFQVVLERIQRRAPLRPSRYSTPCSNFVCDCPGSNLVALTQADVHLWTGVFPSVGNTIPQFLPGQPYNGLLTVIVLLIFFVYSVRLQSYHGLLTHVETVWLTFGLLILKMHMDNGQALDVARWMWKLTTSVSSERKLQPYRKMTLTKEPQHQ